MHQLQQGASSNFGAITAVQSAIVGLPLASSRVDEYYSLLEAKLAAG